MTAALDTAKSDPDDLLNRIDFALRRYVDRDDTDTTKVILETLSFLMRREMAR